MPMDSMYFSYRQFYIYDPILPDDEVGPDWQEVHSEQGFVRRQYSLSMNTLTSYGQAALMVTVGPYVQREYHHRVICVPVEFPTGTVVVDCVENVPEERLFYPTEPGPYLVTVAQTEHSDLIEIYLTPTTHTLWASRIIVCDDELQPKYPLCETGRAAQLL